MNEELFKWYHPVVSKKAGFMDMLATVYENLPLPHIGFKNEILLRVIKKKGMKGNHFCAPGNGTVI